MTERSHLLALMARRQSAELAQRKAEMLRLNRSRMETDQTLHKLESLMAERAIKTATVFGASEFRSARALGEQLAAEAGRQRQRLQTLSEEAARMQADLAQQDYRRQKLEEAMHTARADEIEAKEARAEAAQPSRRG